MMTTNHSDANALTLRHPPGCASHEDEQGGRAITVPGSQAIGLDDVLGALWQMADGVTLAELGARAAAVTPYWREAVQALRQAGLLLPPIPQTRPHPPLPDPAPLVSVIILSKNGRRHLAECLPSVQAQTYPNVEIIIVDDASSDDTAVYVQTHFPQARLVRLPDGPNFSAGNNLGAQHAQGDYYFFLNNDTVLDAHCLQELVAVQQASSAAGVAAMMRLYHHPAFINGLGGRQRRFGFGYDIGMGSLDVGQFDGVAEVPALCFGAALVTRAAWEAVGPLDTRYQFYYEDADWSYRARLLGLPLAAAPRALVYHKFSASMKAQPSTFKLRLATRNRLWFVAKNFPWWAAPWQLWFYRLDDMWRAWQALWRGEWRVTAVILLAWLQFYAGLPGVLIARHRLPRSQRVRLGELERLFPPPAILSETPYLTEGMIATQYRPFLQAAGAGGRQRLLIISPDAVHSRMGGVGIRYWELARQLAGVADVTLAAPHATDLTPEQFTIRQYTEGDGESLRPLAANADVILLSGFTAYHHPFLRTLPAYKIIDIYDPMVLENLERFAGKPMPERLGLHHVGVTAFNDLLGIGDFFICASEKQRDYWLGALTAVNRVNPAVYTADPTLRRLLDVVPTGLPDAPPQHTGRALKGVWPGIAAADQVVLWGGGLWDWLDPLTVINAMPAVLAQRPNARLFFLGTRHPNPDVPLARMAQQALAQAQALGLKDKAIFFNEWTPYEERVNYLCEADVGVSLHGDHVETRFAVRTRLMDYLWARLPMVVNGGDVLGDLAEAHGLGRAVAVGDETAVAEAIIHLLQNPVDRAAFEPVIARFRWSQVAVPLRAYVQGPWRNEGGGGGTAVSLTPPATPITKLPGKVVTAIRQRGLGGLVQDVQQYLRWIQQR